MHLLCGPTFRNSSGRSITYGPSLTDIYFPIKRESPEKLLKKRRLFTNLVTVGGGTQGDIISLCQRKNVWVMSTNVVPSELCLLRGKDYGDFLTPILSYTLSANIVEKGIGWYTSHISLAFSADKGRLFKNNEYQFIS